MVSELAASWQYIQLDNQYCQTLSFQQQNLAYMTWLQWVRFVSCILLSFRFDNTCLVRNIGVALLINLVLHDLIRNVCVVKITGCMVSYMVTITDLDLQN